LLSSGGPLAGLAVSVCECELFIPVSGCAFDFPERVFVLLACRLDEGHEQDEAEEEQELALIALDGVHAVQGQRLAETLVAHVERGDETEVLHARTMLRVVRRHVYVWHFPFHEIQVVTREVSTIGSDYFLQHFY